MNKKPKYQPPVVMPLGDLVKGQGKCRVGSGASDSGGCSTGIGASASPACKS